MPRENYRQNQILIGNAGNIDSFLKQIGGTLDPNYHPSIIDSQLVNLPANLSVEDAIRKFGQSGLGGYAEPNHLRYLADSSTSMVGGQLNWQSPNVPINTNPIQTPAPPNLNPGAALTDRPKTTPNTTSFTPSYTPTPTTLFDSASMFSFPNYTGTNLFTPQGNQSANPFPALGNTSQMPQPMDWSFPNYNPSAPY